MVCLYICIQGIISVDICVCLKSAAHGLLDHYGLRIRIKKLDNDMIDEGESWT